MGANIYKNKKPLVFFLLPAFLFMIIYLYYPFLRNILNSFMKIRQLGTAAKGWNEPWYSNYVKMFTRDSKYLKSLSVTFFYAFVSVPLKLLMALIVAMIMTRQSRVTGLYRSVYYLPSIIGGSVAVAVMWKQLFASDGVINSVLQALSINSTKSWIGSRDSAIWVLILLTVWQFGSSMLIFLAGLKQIPKTYYEAATIDGAGKVRGFFSITLPLLTPTIFFNLVMQTINGFMVFNSGYIITQGKPLNSTLFYALYLYQKAFTDYDMGYACAMAWVLLVIIGLMTALPVSGSVHPSDSPDAFFLSVIARDANTDAAASRAAGSWRIS